jgi:hypothetical protein
MTTAMVLLAAVGVATPLLIIGDRLSVFISPGPFLSLMGKVGGYNHLKQLGVGSTIAGQLLVAAIGGAMFGLLVRRNASRASATWAQAMLVCRSTPRAWSLLSASRCVFFCSNERWSLVFNFWQREKSGSTITNLLRPLAGARLS